MYSTTSAGVDAGALSEQLMGTVTVPGDAGWDSARQAWNLAVDQRPAAVAEPETVADVVAIVNFARERGLRVAAQGTGHAASALAEASLHDTILVKTHRMRVVEIDPDSRRAQAQAGALWSDVVGPASEHGLAALAGSSHDVGVVGYCLGGGLSWLGRKHGLAANSVTAVQIVTADGRVVVADAHHDADLFWAVRGGGGSFGIVTAIELALYPVEELYAGMLAFPVERAAEVLRAWREWVRTVPDEATSVGRVMHFPPHRRDPGADARAVVRDGRDGLPRRRGVRVGAARAAARARPRDGHVRAGDPGRPAPAAHGPAPRGAGCRRRRAARRHAR